MQVNLLKAEPKQVVESVSKRIIREIEKAKFSIWIANVWFADTAIYDLLIKKIDEGLNVEIVLNKSKFMDCKESAKIKEFIDAGGEFYMVNETSNNRMLDKGFCMIDYVTIIDEQVDDGSYLESGFNTYFMREYPEALVEHYMNQYLAVKNNHCINRYG